MAFPVTLNGRTYTLADFSGTNYVEGFPAALEDFVAQAGNIYTTTSTSSVAIGTGSKTFTVADSGKPYTVGTPLRIADAAAPATNWIDGIVTSYSGTTLVVNAVAYAGSGTIASWNINIGGSAIAYTGTLPVAQGGTGATTAADARTNLGLGSAATSAATDFVSQTSAIGSAIVPTGTDAQRDGTPSAGYFRFNTNSGNFEGYDGTAWGAVGGGVDLSAVDQDIIPATDNTYDLGASGFEWKDLYVDGTANIDSLVADTADINGGTIDGTVIGGSTPAVISGTTITATGDVDIADKIVHTGDTNTAIRFPTADTVTVETAGSERMRIDASGNLLVGTTTNNPAAGTGTGIELIGPTGQVTASCSGGSSGIFNRVNSDGLLVQFRRDGSLVGSVSVTASATAYNTSSDYRLKEDVQPMVGSVDRLMALKPVNFAWKVDGSRVDGFLAHEAQEVVPEAVTGEKDGEEMQAIDHSKLVPLLTAALQEALTEIADLKARLNALEGQ